MRRRDCFSHWSRADKGPDETDEARSTIGGHQPVDDDKGNQQLWKRLRNEVVEDRELLEGAQASPAKIRQLAQDWVHSHPGAKVTHSPRYRCFLVVDDEAVWHLLRLPMPVAYERSVPAMHSVKVFDAEFLLEDSYFNEGGESFDDEDEDDDDGSMCSGEVEGGYTGWFWIPATMLAWLWFHDGNEINYDELICLDTSWDGERRFMHVGSSVYRQLPL
jgi:hypothetical protein